MKILVVVSEFPKVTETFVLRNVQHYMTAGHEVDVFHIKPFRAGEVVHGDFADVVGRGFGLPWVSLGALAQAFKAPVTVARCAAQICAAFLGKPRHLAISLALISKGLALAAYCRRTGVQHLHAEFAGYPATVAWIAARVSRVPFSFSAHAHDIFITQGLLAQKARDAQFVRSISEFNTRFLEALPDMPEDKIEVLRCGVSLPNPPAQLKARSGPFKVVFVGALLPRKGVDVLLRALAALPQQIDWTLDILGGGSQDERLRALTAELRLDKVTFHGPQPSDKVRAAMQDADVVAVPSREGAEGRSEGIPVVLMEAMSLACPVVASRLSGIPELVIDGDTGLLVPPDDSDALCAALTRLARAPDLAEALALAGRDRVADMFDIEQTANQLLTRIIETTP